MIYCTSGSPGINVQVRKFTFQRVINFRNIKWGLAIFFDGRLFWMIFFSGLCLKICDLIET